VCTIAHRASRIAHRASRIAHRASRIAHRAWPRLRHGLIGLSAGAAAAFQASSWADIEYRIVDLGTPTHGGETVPESAALGLNDTGIVVGWTHVEYTLGTTVILLRRPFVWFPEDMFGYSQGMHIIPMPAGGGEDDQGEAHDVNEQSHVVGFFETFDWTPGAYPYPNFDAPTPFFWTPQEALDDGTNTPFDAGETITLPTLDATGWATAITDEFEGIVRVTINSAIAEDPEDDCEGLDTATLWRSENRTSLVTLDREIVSAWNDSDWLRGFAFSVAPNGAQSSGDLAVAGQGVPCATQWDPCTPTTSSASDAPILWLGTGANDGWEADASAVAGSNEQIFGQMRDVNELTQWVGGLGGDGMGCMLLAGFWDPWDDAATTLDSDSDDTGEENELSIAEALNEIDEIAGSNLDAKLAMLWQGSGTWSKVELNDVVDMTACGWDSLWEAHDISNGRVWMNIGSGGWIVGVGDIDEGTGLVLHAFLLVPIGACPADIDGSGEVDFDDLLAVSGAYGTCPVGQICFADVDADCDVDFNDTLQVLTEWGSCASGLMSGPGEELLAVWLLSGGLEAIESGAVTPGMLDSALSLESPVAAFASLMNLMNESAEEDQ